MAKKTTKNFTEEDVIQEFEKAKLNYKVSIKCKNQRQKEFLNLLKDKSKTICFGMGSAGSGKSFISLSYALQALKTQEFQQIIMLVPTCQGGSKALNLGFLKGSLEDKYAPFQQADIYTLEKILKNSENKNYKDLAKELMESDLIRYELVNFARGKNFDDALILINESENYNADEMLLLLTRIGENSKIVITGDEKQMDRHDISQCGMNYAYEHLKNLDEVGMVEFTDDDIVRNPLIGKILEHWN